MDGGRAFESAWGTPRFLTKTDGHVWVPGKPTRVILTMCQEQGAQPQTFSVISQQLGNKTPTEVSRVGPARASSPRGTKEGFGRRAKPAN